MTHGQNPIIVHHPRSNEMRSTSCYIGHHGNFKNVKLLCGCKCHKKK